MANIYETIMSGNSSRKQENNSELVEAVKGLKDTENRYIIVFDNSFDNL